MVYLCKNRLRFLFLYVYIDELQTGKLKETTYNDLLLLNKTIF